MNLTDLIIQLEEIAHYCSERDIHSDEVTVRIRAVDGIKYDIDEVHSSAMSSRTVLIHAK